MASKKRQAKNSKVDKALLLPSGLFLIVFDLICIIKQVDKNLEYDFYRFSIGSVLCYLAVVYIFEGFYHWWHPIPGFVEDITAEALEQEQAQQDNVVVDKQEDVIDDNDKKEEE